MIEVQLPDNSVRSFDLAISILDVAKDISPSLAKATLAGIVDGQLHDASYIIKKNCNLKIITDRDDAGLDIIRHSTAHLLAQAVKQLYPTVQVTIGPVIDNGFYYDFSYERPFTPEDLHVIEKRMHELVNKNLPVTRIRYVWTAT